MNSKKPNMPKQSSLHNASASKKASVPKTGEPAKTSNTPRLRIRITSLKATLAAAILVTVGATAAIVHVPWLFTSRRNVEIVVAQLDEEITRQTKREVGNIFNNVKSAQKLIQNMFLYNSDILEIIQTQEPATTPLSPDATLVDLYDAPARETFYFSILEAVPNFTWVEFGYPNGDFLGLQRGQDGVINVINRRWNADQEIATKTIESYQTQDGQITFLEQQEFPEDYYAPQRPWYQVALQNPGQQAWTDVYVFATGKIPGIDSSITLYQDDELLGVISIAFELEQISLFLQELQQGKPGSIFVINSKTELIAFSDPREMAYVLTGGDSAQLKRLDEASSEYLNSASEVLKANNVDFTQTRGRESFTYTDSSSGEKFYVSLAPLPYLDWLVGTVIPESNYVSEIERNKRILFFAVSGFIVLAAGAAILLAERVVARPILHIANAAAAIETETFEIKHLDRVAKRADELGQLARVFQNMAREVYIREQKLKQQVQELKIEIDETKRRKQVNEIVETDFFKDLQAKARNMRSTSRRAEDLPKPKGS